MTKFYTFSQNNSGGYFERDDNLAEDVIIEANDAKHANNLAEEKGIYFDGCYSGIDCNCCGDRWDRVDDGEGKDRPLIYGSDLEGCNDWRLHLLDGTVKSG